MEAHTLPTEQTGHEPGSDAWIEDALAAGRVSRFVAAEADTGRVERESTKKKKIRFLEIYESTLGVVKDCCKAVGISRTTYYEWKDSDADFRQVLQNIDRHRVEVAEDELYTLIKNGDAPTVRWYLERVTEKYKARKVLEHHTDDKTFEDEVDAIIAVMTGQKPQNDNTQQQPDTAPTHPGQGTPEGAHGEQAADPQ